MNTSVKVPRISAEEICAVVEKYENFSILRKYDIVFPKKGIIL